MRRDSFVFYRSFYDSIKALEPIIFYEIIKAIIEYALNGESYSGSNATVNMVFTLIKPQIDANNIKYANGKKGGRPSKDEKPEVSDEKTNGFSDEEPNGNANANIYENANANIYENANANINENVNDITHPSLSDIEAYVRDASIKDFDYEYFFNHYQSIGWKINRQPITDWKALIRKWVAQDATNKNKSVDTTKKDKPKNGASSSFEGRDYDFDELEKMALSD